MASGLSESEMDAIVSCLKDNGDLDPPMQVLEGGATKRPMRVTPDGAMPAISTATAQSRKQMRDEARRRDPLVHSLKRSVTDPKAVESVLGELVDDIFTLKYERERLESYGRDITATTSRRVQAVRALLDAQMKLRAMSQGTTIDFNSEAMKIVMRLIFTKIQDSLKEAGWKKPDIQAFFRVFQRQMDGFEVEAKRLVEQSIK